jgi:L-rhamnose mutarotase
MKAEGDERRRPMLRKAFIMGVNPDQQEEYEKRHNPIWPELQQVLKSHGVHNYSIFLDRETSQLFAYVEIEDGNRWDAIARTEACQLWWKHMKAIMSSNLDNSPKSKSLKEVFHLD